MTVWRMLAWLGRQVAALAKGRELIQQRDPCSSCHRFVGGVAPHKFRSPERERLLRQSRQLLHLQHLQDWPVLHSPVAAFLKWPKILDIQTDICILVHRYVRISLLGN